MNPSRFTFTQNWKPNTLAAERTDHIPQGQERSQVLKGKWSATCKEKENKATSLTNSIPNSPKLLLI